MNSLIQMLRKALSILAVLPLLYACEPKAASVQNYQALASGGGRGVTIGTMHGYNGEYQEGYVGQIIQAKGEVLYQADNHDVAELVKTPDGKYAVKFVRPGRVVVTILRYIAPGKFTATNNGFEVKETAQSLEGSYVSCNSASNSLVPSDQLAIGPSFVGI